MRLLNEAKPHYLTAKTGKNEKVFQEALPLMLPVWLSKAHWRSAVIVTGISMHVTIKPHFLQKQKGVDFRTPQIPRECGEGLSEVFQPFLAQSDTFYDP